MITLAGVGFRNWRCFKGQQRLALTPQFYAIAARLRTDPERSNGFGKSSIPAAIDWCLHGRLPEDCGAKRDLITHGEKNLEVEATLSNGVRIIRSFGSAPERLKLFPANVLESDALLDDEAQAEIEKMIGLSKEDFLLSYIRQDDMARMVVMQPAARMEVVSGWIRLAKLEDCEEEAAKVQAELAKRIEAKRVQKQSAANVIAYELEGFGCEDSRELAAKAPTGIEAAEQRVQQLRQQRDEEREREQVTASAARYDAIVAEGSALKARLDEEPALGALVDEEGKVLNQVRALSGQRDIVRTRYNARRLVAVGKFDGVCPLAGERCPAPDFVQRTTAANVSERDKDVAADRTLTAQIEPLEQRRLALGRAIQQRRHDEQRIVDLRVEAKRHILAKEKWVALAHKEGMVSPAELGVAEQELEQLRALRAQHQRCMQTVAEQRAREGAIDAELIELEKAMRIASTAMAVFGKSGAQRRMAEGVLVDIEDRANVDVLAEAGIDLSLKVVWSRETGALAAACGSCGAPFPASKRVRQCERCGAERGRQMQNKLELVPRARSGALDAISGFAFQVAASAWLRQDRGAGWGVAMLDEPIAKFDTAYRKALSQHLPGILGRAGYGQGFVIAHNTSVLDAMPARIQIESDGVHSTASVVP